MTDFRTDGFLSNELSHYESQIGERYSDELDFAKEVNRIAHEIIGSVQISRNKPTSRLMGTLLVRQTETFQAFLILIGKGLLFPSQVLWRNIAESMFIVGAINKDPAFAEDYIASDKVSRLKLARRVTKLQQRRGITPDIKTETLIRGLEKETDRKKAREFRTEEIAKKAQMEDYYDTVYALASMTTHTRPRSLNEVFVVGTSGEVEALDYQPKVDNLESYLLSGVEMVLLTLEGVTKHFSFYSQIEEMKRRLKTLMEQ